MNNMKLELKWNDFKEFIEEESIEYKDQTQESVKLYEYEVQLTDATGCAKFLQKCKHFFRL